MQNVNSSPGSAPRPLGGFPLEHAWHGRSRLRAYQHIDEGARRTLVQFQGKLRASKSPPLPSPDLRREPDQAGRSGARFTWLLDDALSSAMIGWRDSNPRPTAYQAVALPSELSGAGSSLRPPAYGASQKPHQRGIGILGYRRSLTDLPPGTVSPGPLACARFLT